MSATSPAGPPVEPTRRGELAEDPELVADFLLEAGSHLEQIENLALALEQDAGNQEAIHAAFRGFHTIKGLAGFLELQDVRDVSHEVETLLDLARDGKLAMTPPVIDGVLASADYLRQSLAALENPAGRPMPDPSGTVARVRALLAAEPPGVEESARPPAALAGPRVEEPDGRGRLVKVDTAKLDHLIDMVGELVIAQAMLCQDPEVDSQAGTRFARSLADLSRVTTEVQRTALSMRMGPVGSLFQRMALVVRDVARRTGKRVDVEIDGGDTEIDRNMVEALADPLLHMVRNAVDHGVEPAEARAASGKPAVARVSLRAAHQAGHVIIEISDDGKGLDRERILAKARRLGLVDADATPGDEAIFGLIFAPGFSTAEQVTELSGRGVGMDVVRRQVSQLRGRIDVASLPGQGTSFQIRLPLTLAIVEGLLLRVGRERVILPLHAVREMLCPKPEDRLTIEGRAQAVLVRGNVLPVIDLASRLGLHSPEGAMRDLLVVVETGAGRCCLAVDELIGKQEAVVKSLGELLKDIRGVAGGTILGDGRVGLVLDVESLLRGGPIKSPSGPPQ